MTLHLSTQRQAWGLAGILLCLLKEEAQRCVSVHRYNGNLSRVCLRPERRRGEQLCSDEVMCPFGKSSV